MRIFERNLQKIGESLLVSLPKEWTRLLNLKKGSRIKIIISEQGNLSIAPEFVNKQEKKESTIIYDEHFQRHFFKEYFNGDEKIKIIFKNEITPAKREEFYNFIKKFMTVQIIEETSTRIITKSFRIDELSIEECLKRMYYLSLNMIDETIEENNQTKMKEMEKTITRFYYLLVMQIRRYLSEGKFTEQNQISLIRAMDCRMAAERIERIADIMEKINIGKNKEAIDLIKKTKEYYENAFQSFINVNYDKASTLLFEEKTRREEINKIIEQSKKIKDMERYEQTTKIMQSLIYAKEISMLVR